MATVKTFLFVFGTAASFISLGSYTTIDDQYHTGDEDLNSNLQMIRNVQTRALVEHNASQSLPPFPKPPLPDYPSCKKSAHGVAGLPSIAMVIPYLHERWAHIEATVASIISYTPADLLDEILFIDDGNDADWQYHDMLQAIHPKVKVHRNPRRLGLIKSKVIGADLTNSSVIMFMEPHCIVSQHWLEPLLMQMTGPSHNMVVVPTLDIIPENNFSEYQLAGQSLGGFDWNLQFNWFTEISKRNKSWKDAEPYPSPALSGGIFAIWRDFWENSGKYDASMLEWGGENIEMSLRIWRCGGRIEIVPCSRIGHRFRKSFPYAFHLEAQNRNPARVAEVWLDDYKEDVYEHAPQLRSTDAGDFTERLKLKERLKCKSMEWYIENVYPELRQSSLVWKRKHGLVYIDASS